MVIVEKKMLYHHKTFLIKCYKNMNNLKYDLKIYLKISNNQNLNQLRKI